MRKVPQSFHIAQLKGAGEGDGKCVEFLRQEESNLKGSGSAETGRKEFAPPTVSVGNWHWHEGSV